MITNSEINEVGLWSHSPTLQEARCWIFGSSEPLHPSLELLSRILMPFINQWNAHGKRVEGAAALLYDRFLVMAQGLGGEVVSGCSIDSMKNELARFEKASGIQLLDASRVYWRDANGQIKSADREKFKSACRNGEVTLETEVFDTLIDKAKNLRVGVFTKPLRESWHARLYASAQSLGSVA